MNQKINYQLDMDKKIKTLVERDEVPTLLIHSCCAPCSSYVLEYLSQFFRITIFFYNPNIYPEEEYGLRVIEQQRLIDEMPMKHKVNLVAGEYNPKEFYSAVKGFESEKEGGERCFRCYRLRLTEAAILASKNHFDYFATTLTISPLKKSDKLNEIGKELEKEYGVNYLSSDFKKKEGYKRSTQLSSEYNLYRQNYCGCVFSKQEMQKNSSQEINE